MCHTLSLKLLQPKLTYIIKFISVKKKPLKSIFFNIVGKIQNPVDRLSSNSPNKTFLQTVTKIPVMLM